MASWFHGVHICESDSAAQSTQTQQLKYNYYQIGESVYRSVDDKNIVEHSELDIETRSSYSCWWCCTGSLIPPFLCLGHANSGKRAVK